MTVVAGPDLRKVLDRTLLETRITDIHTHLFAPGFGDLLAWGIDELLTYHYLVAEFFRQSDLSYGEFFSLSRSAQADRIWKTLFLDHAPLSEACRGVLTALSALGLDPAKRDLGAYREYFVRQDRDAHIERVFRIAGIGDCVMTNDPFDDAERAFWLRGVPPDPRFKPALRVDPVLLGWDKSWRRIHEWGYKVEHRLTPKTLRELQRFLRDWARRTGALYVGVSLPPTFEFPDSSFTTQLLARALLPVCEELNLPLAMMVGVRRQVQPELRMAGDGMGRGSVEAVEALCAKYPKNKFMATFLSRENQHQLCVAARKFRNLLVFGCWWFVNNPSIVEEITRERFELLGPSFVPQHSDARVLEQVIYKWAHSKKILGDVLYDKYRDLQASGWTLDEREIARDAGELLGGAFWSFLRRSI